MLAWVPGWLAGWLAGWMALSIASIKRANAEVIKHSVYNDLQASRRDPPC